MFACFDLKCGMFFHVTLDGSLIFDRTQKNDTSVRYSQTRHNRIRVICDFTCYFKCCFPFRFLIVARFPLTYSPRSQSWKSKPSSCQITLQQQWQRTRTRIVLYQCHACLANSLRPTRAWQNSFQFWVNSVNYSDSANKTKLNPFLIVQVFAICDGW